MPWQDIVIAVVQWVFALTLLPSVLSEDKPALATSVLTGIVLAVLAFTFSTLNLWNATLSTAVVSIMWWILAFQSYRRLKARRESTPQAPSDI